jgi:hypothetical protein
MTHGYQERCECLHLRSSHVDGTCLDCDPRTRGCDHEFIPYQGEAAAPYLAEAAEDDPEPEPEQDHVPSHGAEARAYALEQWQAGAEAER